MGDQEVEIEIKEGQEVEIIEVGNLITKNAAVSEVPDQEVEKEIEGGEVAAETRVQSVGPEDPRVEIEFLLENQEALEVELEVEIKLKTRCKNLTILCSHFMKEEISWMMSRRPVHQIPEQNIRLVQQDRNQINLNLVHQRPILNL